MNGKEARDYENKKRADEQAAKRKARDAAKRNLILGGARGGRGGARASAARTSSARVGSRKK